MGPVDAIDAARERVRRPRSVDPRSSGHRASPSFWVAFYRDQARLIWEWRATRLSLIRRAVLSYLAAMAALLIVATVSAT